MPPAGLPHSDTLESQLGCQLLEDYRRLLRPSSAPGAKASTVCPKKLDHRKLKDARVHCAVLKQRANPDPSHHHPPPPPANLTSTRSSLATKPDPHPKKQPQHRPTANSGHPAPSPFPQDPTAHQHHPPHQTRPSHPDPRRDPDVLTRPATAGSHKSTFHP